jgi:antirestriction protein ArdC
LASRGRRAYRGINVLILWVSGQMFGYEENTWMTYRQAQDLGGQALKGEEGTLVIKYGTFGKGARRRRGPLEISKRA